MRSAILRGHGAAFFAVVAHAQHGQGVAHAGEAHADAALGLASSRCCSSGQKVTSSTLSSARTWVATTFSKARSRNGRPPKPNGLRTKRVRMMGPRSQQP
jgi:hypothetical protein